MSSPLAAAIPLHAEVNWLFLDLNSFFASCEQQEHPELRGRPMAVVPLMAESTCAIAASYEAKAFGVKTGTRVADARRMCPGIVFVPARPRQYVLYHHRILSAIERHIPVEHVLSIDEVACRLMGRQRLLPQAVDLARTVKAEIASDVGECLTGSIGLSTNIYLSKLGSDLQKPNGLTILLPDTTLERIAALKLTDLPNVGTRMAQRLMRAGIYDVPTLYAADRMRLRAIWGGVGGARFHAQLHGEDLPITPTNPSSIGHQHVLEPEYRNREGGLETVRRLLVKGAERMRGKGYYCTKMSVDVKFTRQLGYWENGLRFNETQDTGALLGWLEQLWQSYPHGKLPLRVGVVLHGLVEQQQHQPSLFDVPARRRALQAVDAINQRFGRGTISFGSNPALQKKVGTDKIAFQRVPELYEV